MQINTALIRNWCGICVELGWNLCGIGVHLVLQINKKIQCFFVESVWHWCGIGAELLQKCKLVQISTQLVRN